MGNNYLNDTRGSWTHHSNQAVSIWTTLPKVCRAVLLGFGLVHSCGPEQPIRYQLADNDAVNNQGIDTEVTKYPIVLLHGFFGWQAIFHIDYFYGVPKLLREKGFRVAVTKVDAVNRVEVRAKQLVTQIDDILAETGAAKVNLVAHSMGGLDARYLVSVLGYGSRVASVTTIGTPHQGTLLADAALGLIDATADVGQVVRSLFEGVHAFKLFGPFANKLERWDLQGALHDLSSKYVKDEFNELCPDDSDVYYQSYGGNGAFAPRRRRMQPDLLDPMIAVTRNFISHLDGDNDGFVSLNSASHGEYRGTVPGDHLDEVGQLFGRAPEGFDHREFYLSIARNLAHRGF